MEERRKYRHYDQQFKIDAVRLVVDGGQSVSQVSRDLGIARSMLQRWVKEFQETPGGAFPGKDQFGKEQQQIEELRRKLALAEEEREILKKALAVFSGRQR
jgi:transposase